MSDANMGIEQGVVVEQQPKPVVAGEAPVQEPLPQQRRQINIQNFYKDEIARRKVEQTLPGQKAWDEIEKAAARSQKAWDEIEKAAARRESPHRQEDKRQVRPRSIMGKVHRKILLMQARLEGVRDLGRFQELADYFESTVQVPESKQINVPEGLSDEQKKKVIEDWNAKGWLGYFDDYNHKSNKHAKLELSRSVPFRLGREHVKHIKNLVSADNNPVELAEGLQKMVAKILHFQN